MDRPKLTHFEQANTGRFAIRFSGNDDAFWGMYEFLKEQGALTARWLPDYKWGSSATSKRGAWVVQEEFFKDTLYDRFSNSRFFYQKDGASQHRWDDFISDKDREYQEERTYQEKRREQEHARRQEQDRAQRQREQPVARPVAAMPATYSDALMVLGLTRDTSLREAKKKYYQMAQTCHPDKHLQSPVSVKQENELKAKKINIAYGIVLSYLEGARV